MPEVSPRSIISIYKEDVDETWFYVPKPSEFPCLASTDDMTVKLRGFAAVPPGEYPMKVDDHYLDTSLDAVCGPDRWTNIPNEGFLFPDDKATSLRLVIEKDYSEADNDSNRGRTKEYHVEWDWSNKWLDEKAPDEDYILNIMGVIGVEYGTQFHHGYFDLNSLKKDIDPLLEYWEIPCFKPENLRDAKPRPP